MAAACSCGRMASMSTATETCGWPTRARRAADELKKFPGEGKKGSVVVKFSPEGKVLMTLGKPGVRGNPPEALTDPTDVVTDPANGDIYVAESHTNVDGSRIWSGASRCSTGTASSCGVIGKTGTGPGEFRTPHALEFDSQGRLIVADRHNHRIQILTKDGKFIAEYPRIRPPERAGDRQERHHLHRRLRIGRKAVTRAGAEESGSAVSRTAR